MAIRIENNKQLGLVEVVTIFAVVTDTDNVAVLVAC